MIAMLYIQKKKKTPPAAYNFSNEYRRYVIYVFFLGSNKVELSSFRNIITVIPLASTRKLC